MYYLAAYRHGAGDEDSALQLALECLLLVDDDHDAARISTLDYLIGTILYRRGAAERGLFFATEAVERGKDAPYAVVEAATSTVVAQLYESQSQNALASQYITIAQDAMLRMPEGLDRSRTELSLDLAKARLQVNEKKYDEAESLLQKNSGKFTRSSLFLPLRSFRSRCCCAHESTQKPAASIKPQRSSMKRSMWLKTTMNISKPKGCG